MPVSDVGQLPLYYEIHGTGRPLVLLHGAMSTIETSFGSVLPSLAETRGVIAIERQAHGHTPRGLRAYRAESGGLAGACHLRFCQETSHLRIVGRADWLVSMLLSFLDSQDQRHARPGDPPRAG
jgi:pimeloyl-ACP methyl ester carboxylesterase